MLHERYDQGWSRFEHGNLVVTNPAIQTARVNPVVFRTDNHRSAVIERPGDIADEHVEGEACQLQQTYRELVQAIIPTIRRGGIHQAAMLDHDPFRASCSTGRVDHIRQILRFVDVIDVCGISGVQRLIVQCQYGVQTQPCCGFGCRLAFLEPCLCTLLQADLGQQYRRTTVLQHETNPFGRIICIQRHIGASCLPHRQYANQHVDRTFTQNANNRLASNAFISQSTG
ncbi:hypothetical protein D1872_181600 [compost metagenome]